MESGFRSLAPIKFLGKTQPYTGIYANAGTTLNIAATAQHAGAKADVRYGCGKTKLTKPLIIIEGFDPDSKNDMTSFLLSVTNPNAPEAIKNRIQELEAQGYDMVFINFNNSMDSIERNTRIFKEVVQQLNALKATNGSTDGNVVMGFSMGGLIGRLGLREMELQNIPHQTEAYISVDAPHRGACIPKSLQHLVADFNDILNYGMYGFTLKDFTKPADLAEFNRGITTIKSSASKQMLIDNIFDLWLEVKDKVFPFDTPSILHQFEMHENFYHKYDSVGQPQNCLVYAITNGSIAGQRQVDDNGNTIVDGMQQLYIHQTGINPLSQLHWIYQLTIAMAGIDPKLRLKFELNAQPNNIANHLLYHSDVKLDVRIVNLIFDFTLTYNITRLWVTTKANCKAFDNAPGGNLSITEYMPKVQSMASTLGIPPNQLIPNVERFCFVPTYSSLDLTSNNLYEDMRPSSGNSTSTIIDASINALLYQPTTAGSSLTSFSFFSAPNVYSTNGKAWNEDHPIPTAHSGGAMFSALLGIPYSIFQVNTLSLLSSNSYNFGQKINTNPNVRLTTGPLIYNDIVVANGNSLSINGEQTIGYSDLPVLPIPVSPDINSTFIVNTRGKKCNDDGKKITIEGSSYLILGSDNDNRNGILEVVSGSKIELKTNSEVKLYNSSKLIMKTGSELIIHPSVIINLADNNSVIEFEKGSKIKLENGATFTFTGDGFIRVMGGSLTPTNNMVNIIAPLGGTISLMGNGKNDKILEIEASSVTENLMILPNTLTSLILSNGLITSNCNIDIGCNAQFYSSKLLGSGNITFNKSCFSTYSDFIGTTLVNYSDAEYNNGNVNGNLEAWMIGANNDKLKLKNLLFNGIESNGLFVYDSRTDISDVHFIHNHVPMRFEAMSYPTTLTNVTINNPNPMSMPISGGNGLYFEGASNGGYLMLDRCYILNQKTSTLHVDNAQVAIACSKINPHPFAYNNSSIYLTNGSTLVIDPTIVTNVGKNDLSGQKYAIVCDNAFDLFLNNGQSDLSVMQYDALNGNLQAVYNPGSSQFNATNNYWKWGSAPTRINHYYKFIDGVNNQFGIAGNVDVNGVPYLLSPPSFDNLCPLQDSEPGGGGQQGKRNLDFEANFANEADEVIFQNTLLSLTIYGLMGTSNDSSELESKINNSIVVLNNYYHTNHLSLKRIMNILYQKTMEHAGRAMSKCKLQSTRNRIGDKLYQLQTLILNQNQFNSDERFKFEMDKVFSLRIQEKYTQSLSQLHGLLLDTQYQNYSNHLNNWICKIENEQLLNSGIISMLEFKSKLSNCSNLSQVQTNVNLKLADNSSKYLLDKNVEILLFPNPSNDYIEVNFTSHSLKGSLINLYATDGRLISTKTIDTVESELRIEVSNIANGTYIFEILNPEFKVVKRISIIH